MVFSSHAPYECTSQILKSVALPVPEIIGGTLKLWAVPGYAVKFIQGHWFWYQSKVRMQLPISPS